MKGRCELENFKVGDKVKLVSYAPGTPVYYAGKVPVGTEGAVSKLYPELGCVRVDFDGVIPGMACFPYELELVKSEPKFKAGDLVNLNYFSPKLSPKEKTASIKRGDIGTVKSTTNVFKDEAKIELVPQENPVKGTCLTDAAPDLYEALTKITKKTEQLSKLLLNTLAGSSVAEFVHKHFADIEDHRQGINKAKAAIRKAETGE